MKPAMPFLVGLVLGAFVGYLVSTGFGSTGADTQPPASEAAPDCSHPAEIAELERRLAMAEAELLTARAGNEVVRDEPAAASAEPADTPAPSPEVILPGTLRVLVTDAEGRPRKGARVHIMRRQGNTKEEDEARTNPDGVAEFKKLVPGRRTIWVNVTGRTHEMQAVVNAGEVTEARVELAAGSTIVEGTVQHRVRGPLADVYVRLSLWEGKSSDSFSTRTDAEGRYRLAGIPAGSYRIIASSGQLGPGKVIMAELEVPESGRVVEDIIAGVLSLYGTVRDSAGVCIPGVRVSIQRGAMREATTDRNGEYRILDLNPGKYSVHASLEGYGFEAVHGVEVTESGRELPIVLKRAATVHVRVVDRAGEPYAGRLFFSIRPVVEGEGTRVGTGLRTDSEGRTTYRKMIPADYKLHFKVDGVGTADIEVKIHPGENTIEVRLR